MNKIHVRGVIVPSSYDGEWANDYIEKGMFIPESRLRKQIEGADKKQALELYINSPGGSVFAGNEMINAVNAWSKETGQAVNVTVGAMAASMAAAMIVNVKSSKVSAHKNSKIMFHGAWSETVGGSEAHKDQADLLAKINNDLKATLVSKYALAPEQVDEWFAEGRAGWVTAEDAKKMGMVSDIVDIEDKPLKISKTANAMLMERGLKIAAAYEGEVIENETGTAVENKGTTETAIPPAAAVAVVTETAPQGVAGDPKNGDPIPGSIVAELSEKLMAVSKERRDWQARYDKSQMEIAKMKTDFEAERSQLLKYKAECDSKVEGLESQLSRLTLTALSLDSEHVVNTWADALAACNGNYIEARAKYPLLLDQYIKINQQEKRSKR
jgi:ATP-dependent Clp protease protease subunit